MSKNSNNKNNDSIKLYYKNEVLNSSDPLNENPDINSDKSNKSREEKEKYNKIREEKLKKIKKILDGLNLPKTNYKKYFK